ncbi:hypothetical protein CDL15_Pgr025431 [Punica granatum]|uniref:Bulb-type lectin domain-containing protein n=1 Tax=Punica granatum TaxID=22663 RepID=A0A218W8Q0_PUNGR|nr:hypothetical protein CDL15_Pgr025431 [Punica granatum]
MQLHRQLAFAAGAIFLLLLFTAPSHGHNISRLLKDHPAFSTFNHYLTQTHLANETITFCAIDNDTISELLASHPSISTIKNVLSLHATGSALGSSGFVNITDLKGSRVGLDPEDNGGTLSTYFVKSLEEVPYNISVIQISGIIPSDVVAAPTSGPSEMNITSLISAHGCKVFADTLLANPDAMKTYQDNAEGGLTVFCPLDDPFKVFLPKYKNLTAASKTMFLEFLAVRMYLSMSILKSNDGLMNTLTTDGASNYDFTVQNEGESSVHEYNSFTALSYPGKTIVWCPRGTIPAPLGSKVELTSNKGVRLADPQGNEIYKSESFMGAASYGVMNNTGNLQLFGVDPSSDPVWESFDFPSDTLLPTQALTRGGVLSSLQSETNFSLGREANKCRKKTLPLYNGQAGQYLSGTALIQVPKRDSSPDSPIFPPPKKLTISNSPVTVKKLMNSLMQDTEQDFQIEVNVIRQTHHKNLVRLQG